MVTSLAPSLGTAVLSQSGSLLERVMAYQNPAVPHRFREKLGLDENQASLLFEDTKRFLYLCGSKRKGDPILAPPDGVDAGWHEFLLFTEDYAQFCFEHFGRFIHHRPRRPEDPKGDGQILRDTRALAIATFVTLSHNWRMDAASCDECNVNCSYACGGLSTNCQDPS